FPKHYIWIQCNTFHGLNASLMCSVAHIPFRKREFTGFIVVLLVDQKEYRFATYNRSKLMGIQNKKQSIALIFKKNRTFLEIIGKKSESGSLKAPKKGVMNTEIQEILDGEIVLRLYQNKKLLFEGSGTHAGIEIVGYSPIKPLNT
ncbi:MAG: hypothetical protein H7X94_04240, partial [Vallitaleaceae bacterium]|nr:hypothetical protein [Vallitaleaceae bacterium]